MHVTTVASIESRTGGVEVVRFTGEVDLNVVPDVQKQMSVVYRKGPKLLVVDLSAVSYMDSSGLAVLVEARSWCVRNSCALRLAALSGYLVDVFQIAHLDQVFKIYDDLDRALEAPPSS